MIRVAASDLDVTRFEALERAGRKAAEAGDWDRAADLDDIWPGKPSRLVSEGTVKAQPVECCHLAVPQSQVGQFEPAVVVAHFSPFAARLEPVANCPLPGLAN